MRWTDFWGDTHWQDPVEPKELVLTIGIYSNGDYKHNWVLRKHLQSHIDYNKNNRFGRALVVDGELIYNGMMSEQFLRQWLQDHPQVLAVKPPRYPTLPYR